MQQWIPRTQTLEPKIWGQVGLRQGLYIGLGVFAGIFFLVALGPFGIGPRIAAALMSVAAGATVGFVKIKGLSPERYLFHRLRFALWRRGVGIRREPESPTSVVKEERSSWRRKTPPKPILSLHSGLTTQLARVRDVAAAPIKCTFETGPFGLGFTAMTLAIMAIALVYLGGVT